MPNGCWGEDSDRTRIGAANPKFAAPFAFRQPLPEDYDSLFALRPLGL
jgi:hypothetical protein